jgi:hypothetical protein
MKNANNKMLLDYIDFTPDEFEELMQQPKMYSKEEERLKKIETDKKVKEIFASLGY